MTCDCACHSGHLGMTACSLCCRTEPHTGAPKSVEPASVLSPEKRAELRAKLRTNEPWDYRDVLSLLDALDAAELKLANALSIANSRAYCLDSPEVLKARVGELESELADAKQALDHANEELTALREYLGPENARLTNELAEARIIGELARDVVESRMAQFIAIDEPDRLIALGKTLAACEALLAARAATGEPKETT